MAMKLYLVRHGHAGSRDWSRHDQYRQLSDRGRDEAAEIELALAEINVGAVISSPATRCVQTVEPLSKRLGLEVIEDKRLWEDADIADAMDVLNENTEDGAVICSHGNIIPEMLHWLLQTGMTAKGRGCAKGSVWTVTYRNGQFTKARYHQLGHLPR
ncbi:MAG: histidine phosphatase family protein [Acidimicrobiales bacterium]|nr:histidine phosphatase family protein [Acidimicrobiales bacterium]